MNVLSLFDGMSCGQIALNKLGINYDNYFASEVDKYAIKIAKKNFPNTEHIGDVKKVKTYDLPKIDILIGGSPCQGFSFAGKQLNFEDPRSKLFFEFVRIWKECKPKYFLLENVRMKKESEDVITKTLGVEPIEINSSLVSAQNRRRLYWTNIPGVNQPENKNVLLKDILEKEVDSKYYLSEKAVKYITQNDRLTKKFTSLNGEKALTLMSQYNQSKNGTFLCVDANGRVDNKKTGALTSRYHKGVENHGSSPFIGSLKVGNVNPSNKGMNGCVYDSDFKSPTITTNKGEGVKILDNELNFRKLTPKECERLQTIPDNYTEGVSNTQRYKMLGNGWTVDVIAHIFSFIKF